MRLAVPGFLAVVLLVGMQPALAEGRLAPNEIQSTFFNGQPFTASTPSEVKFKMTFSSDGKVTREPLGRGGAKGVGTWKLSKEGFCTSWNGGQPNCFVVQPGTHNKWAVLKGAMVIATWSK